MPRSWAFGQVFDRSPRWLVWASHAIGVLLLAAHLVTVACFAHASLPDPTWIPGLYDDADGDAVVAFLVDLSCLADPSASLPVVSLAPCHSIPPEAHAAVCPCCCGLPAERAPPLR